MIFQKIGHILHPVLLGVFLAYLMEPVTSWFQQKYKAHIGFCRKNARFCRGMSVLSCFFFFLFLFLLSITLLSMNLIYYFREISWDGFVQKMNRTFKPALNLIQSVEDGGGTRYGHLLFTMAEGKVGAFLKFLVESTLSLPAFVGQFFIGLIIALYLLIDKETFITYGKRAGRKFFSSGRRKKVRRFWLEFQRVFSGYLKGQALDAFIMGCLLSCGLWLIGVPLGISIGIFAGIGNLVPYLGPFIAYAFTIFFCLLEGKKKTLWIALFYLLIVQQVDGSYIGPKLLGNQIRLRPVFILLAVLVGGTFFGPIGMVLGVPFAGLIKSMGGLWGEKARQR